MSCNTWEVMVHIRQPIFYSKEGLNVVTLPKTIDNDLVGTDVSFGFPVSS